MARNETTHPSPESREAARSCARMLFTATHPRRRARCPLDPFAEALVGLLPAELQGGFPEKPGDLALGTELPQDLGVAFELTEITNTVVSGGGLGGDGKSVAAHWKTSSPVATTESGGPFNYPVPPPGQTYEITYHSSIYRADIEDGCGATPVVPVEFRTWLTQGEDYPGAVNSPIELGVFEAFDDTSLVPNGVWIFDYVIRGSGSSGTSDIRFRGDVSVVCALTDLA